MRNCVSRFILTVLLVMTTSWIGYSQGSTAPLNGIVIDTSGGVVPGAEVTVKNNDTSAEFKAVTSENGTFSIPALGAGTYTATVSMTGFKQAIVKDIKMDAGVPSSIRVTLQVGGSNEVITVEAGAEVVQSQTANITTTLGANQIANLPMASRNALEFVAFLPGVNNTTSTVRDSTVNGLPNNTINITIDGVNTQDNYNRTTDGFFSRVSPRLDAVEEVTVSTATPGAESAGQGAVQIRFVTRSGNNQYHGSLYEYLRNTSLNANDWFNNRDLLAPPGADPLTWKAPRDRVQLNQYGGRVGGPMWFPKKIFGPLGFDGRDKAFFFFNFEESRSPSSVTRNRTIFYPTAEQGIFRYTVGSTIVEKDLMALAASKGQTATFDPTIQNLLGDIRKSTAFGSLNAQTNPLYQTLTFTNPSMNQTRFPTSRFDFNLTSKHRLEISYNFQQYLPLPYDLTNSRDPSYPGSPNWGVQGSNRFSVSGTLRSTLTPRLVNEARYGMTGGTSLFNPNMNPNMFGGSSFDQGGFALGISAAGLYNAWRSYTPSRRNSPLRTFEDTLTWTKGSHGISIGGTWTQVGVWSVNQTLVPSISFGVNTSYDPAASMFSTANFPGASSTQLTSAQNMYAVLTGRVTQIGGTAYLNETSNTYKYNGDQVQRGHMRELGFFVSDAWRVRPGLTVNYGVRWEFQYPFVPGNSVYSTATVADLWGVSGVGNLFKPGVLTGKEPEFTQYTAGTGAYGLHYKDFAPSFGLAWTPMAKGGFLQKILGNSGQTVIRGGYSLAFSRMGMAAYTGVFSANPGGFITATRNSNLGNLVSGTGSDTWPLLLRDKSRLGPPAFQDAPIYPMKGTVSNSVNIFDPGLKMPYTQSWTFGLQRELSKSTALEVRYVGTRMIQGWTTYNLNEQNIIENGMLSEFKLAMANLQANIAAGRGSNFKYYGAGTGTSPLPVTLAYFSGTPASQASDTTKYSSSNFSSTTFVNPLAQKNPAPSTYASNLWSDATRRQNALNAGLPSNFFIVNPSLQGGANFTGNGAYTRYDSMVVELRRRLSKGLLIQANYVWAKAFGSSRYSFRVGRVTTLGDTLPHALKVNWVYELPVGRGRALLSNTNRVLDHVVGGWDFHGVARIQSGNLMDFGNVNLVGMTMNDLKSAYQLRFDDANRIAYILPQDIIDNTIKAYNVSATATSGYSSLGAPAGRYIAPANSNGCIQVITGDCAPQNTFAYQGFFKQFDLSLVKQFRFTESKNFELRAEFLNAFNNVNFDWVANPGSSQTWGQVTGTNSNPRQVQIVLRLNF